MVFGAPLLKKSRLSLKFRPIEEYEGMLRTLGFVRPKESVIVIPSNIKNEVLKFVNEEVNRR
jgi:hypothetical protein